MIKTLEYTLYVKTDPEYPFTALYTHPCFGLNLGHEDRRLATDDFVDTVTALHDLNSIGLVTDVKVATGILSVQSVDDFPDGLPDGAHKLYVTVITP